MKQFQINGVGEGGGRGNYLYFRYFAATSLPRALIHLLKIFFISNTIFKINHSLELLSYYLPLVC